MLQCSIASTASSVNSSSGNGRSSLKPTLLINMPMPPSLSIKAHVFFSSWGMNGYNEYNECVMFGGKEGGYQLIVMRYVGGIAGCDRRASGFCKASLNLD